MAGAMRSRLRSIPTYVWTFFALVPASVLAASPGTLQPVATMTTVDSSRRRSRPLVHFRGFEPLDCNAREAGTRREIRDLGHTLVRIELVLGGPTGTGRLLRHFPHPLLHRRTDGAWTEAISILGTFKEQSSASLPLIAILGSVALGAVAASVEPLYNFLAESKRASSESETRWGTSWCHYPALWSQSGRTIRNPARHGPLLHHDVLHGRSLFRLVRFLYLRHHRSGRRPALRKGAHQLLHPHRHFRRRNLLVPCNTSGQLANMKELWCSR